MTLQVPAITERMLFRGHRGANRTEPCACGGYLTAPVNDFAQIAFAVQRHQQTANHLRWRAWREASEA